MNRLLVCTVQLVRILLLLTFCIAGSEAAATLLVNRVGFQQLRVNDPVSKQPMEAVYFYPSAETGEEVSNMGPYQIAARNSAKIASDRYPLVIISHGNAGSLWGHHSLATGLAQQGNIVITLNHPKDNYKDQSGVGTASTLYGRPLQISAAITTALSNTDLAPHIDASKIAFIGFSAGGTTGLLLAGGKVDLVRYAHYCTNHPTKAVCSTKGQIKNNYPELSSQPDPRIKAWVLMAPWNAMFSSASLKTLNVPMLIFTGDSDEELTWQQNAKILADELPSQPTLKIIHNAGHFVFLSPCSPELRASVPLLCNDPKGIDRVALHHTINDDIGLFLGNVWKASAVNVSD